MSSTTDTEQGSIAWWTITQNFRSCCYSRVYHSKNPGVQTRPLVQICKLPSVRTDDTIALRLQSLTAHGPRRLYPAAELTKETLTRRPSLLLTLHRSLPSPGGALARGLHRDVEAVLSCPYRTPSFTLLFDAKRVPLALPNHRLVFSFFM
jgi:hypothetical protein